MLFDPGTRNEPETVVWGPILMEGGSRAIDWQGYTGSARSQDPAPALLAATRAAPWRPNGGYSVGVSTTNQIPDALSRIIGEFSSAPKSLRLPLLLEYAGKLPALPPELEGTLERVHECQTPLFLKASLDEAGAVELAFDAPPEAPTTRGFASIVSAGLSGSSVDAALATPEDFYEQMGLSELISPLRLRGLGSIVARVKRQLREAAG